MNNCNKCKVITVKYNPSKYGNTYEKIDCKHCGYFKARLYNDFIDNTPVSGSFSRYAKAETQASSKDVLQPFKNDGIINKDFVSVYGTKQIEKDTGMSKQEISREIERYG